VRTGESQENIVELSDIREEKLRALSPYGPVKAGLTTLPTTQDQPLTELLSSLERKIAELNTKSCTVLDTLTTVTQRIEVALHSNTQTEEAGTDGHVRRVW
jgi:hypothetical protein